jgi:hypothetical protein
MVDAALGWSSGCAYEKRETRNEKLHMNPAHAHLVLNHIPVVGTIIGLIVLAYGMLRRSHEVRMAACFVLVLVALLAIPTFLTGEPAEELVEELPGVSHDVIHEHEEAAELAIWVIEIMGVAALVALLWNWKRGAVPAWLITVVLVTALAAVGTMGWTANLGAKIRHPEITGAPPAPTQR